MAKPRTTWHAAGVRSRRRKKAAPGWALPASILGGAAAIGLLVGAAPKLTAGDAVGAAYAEPLSVCSVTDGDTIRCGDERIRLLAIDAPEMPGHCRRGRACAPGDPYESKASLEDALTGELTIDRVGEDRYGRTLARVAGDKGDLSCWQIERGHAIYKADWDNGLRVARTCPSSIL